jgi:hypothetical protein
MLMIAGSDTPKNTTTSPSPHPQLPNGLALARVPPYRSVDHSGLIIRQSHQSNTLIPPRYTLGHRLEHGDYAAYHYPGVTHNRGRNGDAGYIHVTSGNILGRGGNVESTYGHFEAHIPLADLHTNTAGTALAVMLAHNLAHNQCGTQNNENRPNSQRHTHNSPWPQAVAPGHHNNHHAITASNTARASPNPVNQQSAHTDTFPSPPHHSPAPGRHSPTPSHQSHQSYHTTDHKQPLRCNRCGAREDPNGDNVKIISSFDITPICWSCFHSYAGEEAIHVWFCS